MSPVPDDGARELYMGAMVRNMPVLRAKLGLTQAQLAERIGLTRQTLTAIENGARHLTWNNYLAICFVFDNNDETRSLMNFLQICPENLRQYLGMDRT